MGRATSYQILYAYKISKGTKADNEDDICVERKIGFVDNLDYENCCPQDPTLDR